MLEFPWNLHAGAARSRDSEGSIPGMSMGTQDAGLFSPPLEYPGAPSPARGSGSGSELPGRADSPKNAKGFSSKEAIRIQQEINPEVSCSELPQHGMGHG